MAPCPKLGGPVGGVISTGRRSEPTLADQALNQQTGRDHSRLRAPGSPSWTGHDAGDALLAVVCQSTRPRRYRSAVVIPDGSPCGEATGIRCNRSGAGEGAGHAS